jgi:hypothetical protein
MRAVAVIAGLNRPADAITAPYATVIARLRSRARLGDVSGLGPKSLLIEEFMPPAPPARGWPGPQSPPCARPFSSSRERIARP